MRRTRQVSDPLWGAHVSIVQNEMPPDLTHWRALEGQAMTFDYLHPPQQIGEYAFYPVECAEALAYREVLGLPRRAALAAASDVRQSQIRLVGCPNQPAGAAVDGCRGMRNDRTSD